MDKLSTAERTEQPGPAERTGPAPALVATGIRKAYGDTEILHGIDLTVAEGEFVAVMGPSGSGKSTLLHCLAGLDRVDAGSVRLAGIELTGLSADELADRRRELMGFVFQQPTLLRDLTLLDNIVLTGALDRIGTPAERTAHAEALMARAGIAELRDRMPGEVSGGQLQRAGVCRALQRDPRIVYGDEPTGALNSSAAREVMDLLVEFNRDGTTLVVVTHDAAVAARAHRVVFLRDGAVAEELLLGGQPAERVTDVVDAMRAVGV
ncbi:ABC transporter ATP-binding protein [Granulicoccus phenolivorans]|uniref:ABC transporter ATP-binding protein n=1 Tax=Granulicoccus phenolivorans TaxID=266854 RepID=UPI0009DBCF8D|nr:ATP-binding cassette domain-containing protein [Granulicoccus phenolivorans]